MSRMPPVALLSSIMMFAVAGCQAPAKSPPSPARISHLVFIKLQNPADAEELIRDCDTLLAPIPGLETYACGRHFETGRGASVDSDYDVGLYLGFDSEGDYTRYVEHPNHVAGVNKWRPRWQWIRVVDFLDETP